MTKLEELKEREVKALERLVKLRENEIEEKDRKREKFDGGMGVSHSMLFRR